MDSIYTVFGKMTPISYVVIFFDFISGTFLFVHRAQIWPNEAMNECSDGPKFDNSSIQVIFK